MIHRLLVAIDGSEASRRAAGFAAVLARTFQAEVTLLHVIEPISPTLADVLGASSEAIAEVRRARGATLLDEVALATGLSDAERLVLVGRAPEAICAEAAELGADLIVLGACGEGPSARVTLGRVGERVATLSNRSVTLVR